MRMSLMPIAALKRFPSAAVLASMFSLFVLFATDPAAARVILLSQCQRKHSYCTERCIINSKTGQGAGDCIKRTCDKQNPGCGPSSAGKSGGGKQVQPNPGGSTGGSSGGGVLTSPLGGAGSWTSTGGVFAPKSSGNAVAKTKRHQQPKSPTAEPTPAPTTEPKPTPTAEPTPTPTTPPARPTANVRDHRGSNAGRAGTTVTTTRHTYEGAEKASGTGPSEKRKPKIIDHRAEPIVNDHRGVDAASRDAAPRKPKIIDHRKSSAQPKSGASTGSNCGTQGNPRCVTQ